ncbi:serine/threonine-protein kinase haspin [Morone saxatilis]|uniref:serine/threonine-protein kinase haspin n=1 Tax=Morone saxatilis TaxID=34816 RepID=UPI0015E1EC82|nr:serine/threonine-protein kinase haspin [Morone saxatilis]
MKSSKPLFMKTYVRQKRKLPTWISPENDKQAWDSSPPSTSGRRISVASHRAARPAKKKAILCLTEMSFDDESISSPFCPQPAQQSKTTRKKKTGVSVAPVRRKAYLIETSSDEENINRPLLPRPQPTRHSKTTRKSRLVSVPGVLMRQKGQQVPRTSKSEEDSTSATECHKKSTQMKTDSNLHPPSAGRFVTRRRRAVAAKPPKATFKTLNSSEEFTPGAFGSSRILRPAWKRKRVPPAFVVSSAENSVNAAGTGSFATNPFQEISLNESADHSIGPCPRKPIFCSTPSAGPFSKRPCLKAISINDQSVTPPSVSVSCIGVLSTFQEDLDSPGQPVAPPRSSPPTGIHTEEKPQSSLDEQASSGDLFVESKSTNSGSSCSAEANSHSEDLKSKNAGELPSLNLLSTEDSESSSRFVSAAGGLEWLIEALKEKCLTERCTVQLERFYNLTVTQLCSQTTYSSCLGHSSSLHSQQTNEHPLSVDSVHSTDLSQSSEPLFNLHLSGTNNKTSDYLHSVNGFESSEHAASVTDSRSTNTSPSVDCKQSAETSKEPMDQSASVLYVGSTHHTDSSNEFIMGTQLPANGPVQALFTEEAVVAVKEDCLTKKCTVQLKNWALSQLTVQNLKGFVQQNNVGLACDESANPDVNKSENGRTHSISDPEDLTCSGETTEGVTASVRRSSNDSSPGAQARSNVPETEEKAAALKTMLKEKCQTDKLIVEIKRVTLSQLKEILQLKDRKLKSSTDVSDSSDDQTKNQPESSTNHCNKDTSAMKVNIKKRGSTTSEDKIASDNVRHKRKKTSLAPKEKKRRSTSTDRPGTTRKACVSGLSVTRWKNKDSASTHVFRSRTVQMGGTKAVDCSINELMSAQHKQPRDPLGTTMNFSTPMRASRLNLSSLLADFTPNTHTWSRLKAALSVHRKGMVQLTPRSSRLSVSGSRGRTELADVSQDLFATPFRTPLPKRLQSQLLSSNSLVECGDADLSDAEKAYAECGQKRPLPWEECILPQRMKQCVKIGEGTFGEVFSTTNASGDTVALKIIPVEGTEKVNGEDQKTFGEILHEIIISKELSSLKEKQQNQTHGFIGLIDLYCVQGCYPPDFLNAWDTFDQQKGSENDRPDFFEKDQLFIILEFEFGGIDLENSNGTLASLGVAKSILHQVTAALAVAEQELHFEHRDLHWGNVLVKTTKEKKGSFLLNGATNSLETKGVLVRIIDYSLSRLEIDDLTVSCDISEDEELFMGQGDYQFDIYRLMRQENGNNWSNYHPHTNVLWLHYLCSKLISMKYRGSGGRGAKDIRLELTRFYDNVLQYSSATEALEKSPLFQ